MTAPRDVSPSLLDPDAREAGPLVKVEVPIRVSTGDDVETEYVLVGARSVGDAMRQARQFLGDAAGLRHYQLATLAHDALGYVAAQFAQARLQ